MRFPCHVPATAPLHAKFESSVVAFAVIHKVVEDPGKSSVRLGGQTSRGRFIGGGVGDRSNDFGARAKRLAETRSTMSLH